MIRRPPRSTRTYTLSPYSTLFRSIRPEALHLTALEDGCPPPPHRVAVMASRLMGRTSLVHLRSLELPAAAPHFHARVPGRFLPPEEQRLAAAQDRAHALFFPTNPASEGGYPCCAGALRRRGRLAIVRRLGRSEGRRVGDEGV